MKPSVPYIQTSCSIKVFNLLYPFLDKNGISASWLRATLN